MDKVEDMELELEQKPRQKRYRLHTIKEVEERRLKEQKIREEDVQFDVEEKKPGIFDNLYFCFYGYTKTMERRKELRDNIVENGGTVENFSQAEKNRSSLFVLVENLEMLRDCPFANKDAILLDSFIEDSIKAGYTQSTSNYQFQAKLSTKTVCMGDLVNPEQHFFFAT